MTLNKQQRDELFDLCLASTSEDFSFSDRARLDTLVVDNPDAAEFYIHFLTLSAGLEWEYALDENVTAVGRAPRDEQPPGNASDSRREASPTPRPKSLLQWASRHPKGPAIAIAATLLIAAIVVMGLTPVKQWVAGGGKAGPEEQESAEKKEFVAKLSNWHNDVWLEDTRPSLDDPRLKIGRRLKIESGLIEVTYFTGAQVVIEGPAEFVVGSQASGDQVVRDQEGNSRGRKPADAANSGFLKLGKLVARVQGEKAQGFSIDTPIARVEDLGTEFGVEVASTGLSEVVVLAGEVDLVREGADGEWGERIRLGKNQGAMVRRGDAQITRLASPTTLAARFVKTLPKPVAPESFDAGPFHPKLARVWDSDPSHEYVWRETCGNSNESHQLAGGFEWSGDVRSFLAQGDVLVRGRRVKALIMRAFPNEAVLSAEWPVKLAAGEELRLRFGLSDVAAERSTDGVKLTVVATDQDGNEHTLIERTLGPGDTKVYDKRLRPEYAIEKITIRCDSLDEEFWDVLWIQPMATNREDSEK